MTPTCPPRSAKPSPRGRSSWSRNGARSLAPGAPPTSTRTHVHLSSAACTLTVLPSQAQKIAAYKVPWLYWELISNADPHEGEDYEVRAHLVELTPTRCFLTLHARSRSAARTGARSRRRRR